jgi:hypothetical protein
MVRQRNRRVAAEIQQRDLDATLTKLEPARRGRREQRGCTPLFSQRPASAKERSVARHAKEMDGYPGRSGG